MLKSVYLYLMIPIISDELNSHYNLNTDKKNCLHYVPSGKIVDSSLSDLEVTERFFRVCYFQTSICASTGNCCQNKLNLASHVKLTTSN